MFGFILAAALSLAATVNAHTWTYERGALAAGHDLVKKNTTVAEAKAFCEELAGCVGFTYDSKDANLTSITQVYFKSSRFANMDATWSSWILDMPPPPPTSPMLINPCINASYPQSKQKWCNPTVEVNDRVADMIARMSLAEKIGALRDSSAPIPSLGLPYYDWWNEATHGVASGEHGVRNTLKEPAQSNFPFPITTGMSFNRTLWKATGAQIGKEARAFMNAGNAFSTFWAPVINLAREPRWGRNIECPGEDPYLSGEYSVSFVHGLEKAPEDPYHIQASACCKHYAANSMEGSTEGGQTHSRHDFDANITMQDLVDSYLAPFQACVEKGQVSGLMCSYNAINGVPTCADPWLLQEVARDTWGFDGYITSDCGAEMDVLVNHKFTATGEEALAKILAAGTDSDCGEFFGKYAQSALDKKLVTEADFNKRLAMLFKVRMRLSHFDPVGPLDRIPATVICSKEAIATARDSVAQSVALIKNDAKVLPLDAKTTQSILVAGPNAIQAWDITSYYGPSTSCEEDYWNMVDAVGQYVNNTDHVAGLSSTLSSDLSGIPAAVAKAKGKGVQVVLVLGTDLTAGAEGHDAVNITLPWGQVQLVEAVTAAASKPVVVVMMTHIPLDLTELIANKKIGAIIHAGQPSVQTLGIGDVLFGEKVPAGRLIQTVYPKAYGDEVSIFDFNMRPGPSAFPRPDCLPADVKAKNCTLGTNPGRTYRFYNGKAVAPFGFGLSYTTFNYAMEAPTPTVSLAALPGMLATAKHGFVSTGVADAAGPAAQFTVKVTNTGSMDADDVVLGFITPPGAGANGVPLKTLFGFERIYVKAGETVTVILYPAYTDFTHVSLTGERIARPGQYTISCGVPEGASLGAGYLEHTVQATL